MTGKLILLHETDNVLVCIGPIETGDPLTIDGREVTARQDIAVGHKVARHALKPGDKILKYGAPIGSMTEAAEPGEWVHMHNMKSDYIASHTRDAVREGGES